MPTPLTLNRTSLAQELPQCTRAPVRPSSTQWYVSDNCEDGENDGNV